MTPLSTDSFRERILTQRYLCGPGVADIWLLSANLTDADRKFYQPVISSSEAERVHSFRFKADRDRCLVGRGGLRWILSRYSGLAPESLRFEARDYSKPAIVGGACSTQFNVSHSGHCVVIVVTGRTPCGIDIEQARPIVSEQDIAEKFFCPREALWMKDAIGFFRLWTLKEAVIKAMGFGLTIPLSSVDVLDVLECRTSTILVQVWGRGEQKVSLSEINAPHGYAAAVAVLGEPHTLRIMP
jgi:4'-phosphopantetheinyl transferase